MKAQAIKDLLYSRYLEILFNGTCLKALATFERISNIKYRNERLNCILIRTTTYAYENDPFSIGHERQQWTLNEEIT